MPTASKRVFIEETEEELLKMSRAEATLNMTDREISFCEFYCGSKNVKMSAIRAGYSKTSAHIIGWKIRQKENCNRYLCWLKVRTAKKCDVSAMDLIDLQQRIAFADITEVVTIKNGKITAKNGDEIDGQIISKIRHGRDGLSIELENREHAIDKLLDYFDVMPKDWRYEIEISKLKIMELRLELEKEKSGLNVTQEVETNFIEALGLAAKDAWSDEKEENEKQVEESDDEENWDDEDDWDE